MYRSKNVFGTLADRAEVGDSNAQGELRRKLEPEIVRMVRRVVRNGAGQSSVDRCILAEASRVGLDARAAASAEGEHLIRKVAQCVSSRFVEGLRSAPVRQRLHQDTVCN